MSNRIATTFSTKDEKVLNYVTERLTNYFDNYDVKVELLSIEFYKVTLTSKNGLKIPSHIKAGLGWYVTGLTVGYKAGYRDGRRAGELSQQLKTLR